MESEYRHYVPVLRAKQAEWLALGNLAPSVRASLTPLVELTPDVAEAKPSAAERAGRTTLDHSVYLTLDHIRGELEHSRVFLDFSHLGAKRAGAWRLLRKITGGPVAGLVPVVTAPAGDGRLGDLRALTSNGVGVCLRVPARVVAQGNVVKALNAELQVLDLTREDTDLIVDLACDPSSITHNQLRAALPALNGWRSWTVLAGVFPLDLADLDADTLEYRLPREEWLTWRRQVVAAPPGARRPSFGDFTVQYGEYVPALKVPGSLSVRYTLETEFLVLRGRKPNAAIGVGFDQYHGHARYLTAKSDYFGAAFSAGDAFINGKCATGKGPGDRRQWLAAAINHHLTATVAQLNDPAL